MAKRFTDTNKYRSPFYRGLEGPYKLLWDFLYHDCNHAGIWIVDFEIAQVYIGNNMVISKEKALEFFNEKKTRIVETDNGIRWFIPSFIKYQYDNELNPINNVHGSVIKELKKYNLWEEYESIFSPSPGAKDKVKDKYKEKNKVKEKSISKSINIPFSVFWDLYEKKRGDKRKIEPIWNSLTDEVRTDIVRVLPQYKISTPDKQYRLDPSKYLRQRAWEDEIIVPEKKHSNKPKVESSFD